MKPIGYGIFLAGIIYAPLHFFETRLFSFLDRKPHAPSFKLPKQIGRFIWRVRSRTHRNSRFKRGCALALTYMLIIASLTGFALVVVPQVKQSYTELVSVAPKYLRSAQRWLDNFLENMPFSDISADFDLPISPNNMPKYSVEDLKSIDTMENPLVLTVEQARGNKIFNIVKQIRANRLTVDLAASINKALAGAIEIMSNAMPKILDFLGAFMTEVKNITLGLVISAYLLSSYEKLLAQVNKFITALLPRRVAFIITKIGRITALTFSEYVTGKLIDALVIGILCTILMFIFRIPYAPLIGLLVGVTNVIPFLGPFLGAVPGSIIIFIVNPIKALWFVLLIIVIQQLDCNFIEPYIVGGKTGLASVYIITSVIVMGGIFGIPGLFLGVPAFAVIYALIKDWSESRLAKKKLPVETASYAEGAEINADAAAGEDSKKTKGA